MQDFPLHGVYIDRNINNKYRNEKGAEKKGQAPKNTLSLHIYDYLTDFQ